MVSFPIILGLTGITLILVNGSIFNKPRNWLVKYHERDSLYRFGILAHAILTCSQCSGMWVGMIGVLIFDFSHWYMFPVTGGLVSLLSVFFDFLFNAMFNLVKVLEILISKDTREDVQN